MSVAPLKIIFASLCAFSGSSIVVILYGNTENAAIAEKQLSDIECVDDFLKNGSNRCHLESFDEKIIEKITLTSTHRINLAERWLEQAPKLPEKFFKKYETLSRDDGVCHIEVDSVTIDSKPQKLYIPFLSESEAESSKRVISVQLVEDKSQSKKLHINMIDSRWQWKVDQDFESKLDTMAQSVPDSSSKSAAKMTLFIHNLYKKTMDIFKKEYSNSVSTTEKSSITPYTTWHYRVNDCNLPTKTKP